MLRRLPDLVRHPGAEIAVFGLGLAFLHKRDAGSAMRNAVAIENGQVHQRVVENMSDDRGERLSAVNVRKAVVAGKARSVNHTTRPTVGTILVIEASRFEKFGCFGPTAAPEMISPESDALLGSAKRCFASFSENPSRTRILPMSELIYRPDFLEKLGRFHAVWATTDVVIDIAVGRFLNLPHEETHLVTAAMEFGRKATLLRGLVARSKHPNKETIMKGLNAIQNASKRNTFAHSYQQSTKDKVIFVERIPHGRFSASKHTFTLPQFRDHVLEVIKAGRYLHDGLGITQKEMDDFVEAALNMSKDSSKSRTASK
jgi:hypothetical protein